MAIAVFVVDVDEVVHTPQATGHLSETSTAPSYGVLHFPTSFANIKHTAGSGLLLQRPVVVVVAVVVEVVLIGL